MLKYSVHLAAKVLVSVPYQHLHNWHFRRHQYKKEVEEKEKAEKVKKGTKGGKSKGASSSSSSAAAITSSNFRSFDQIMKRKDENSQHFYKITGHWICFSFQEGKCTIKNCNRVHCCIGCGKAMKPYNECGCLESVVV